MTIGISKERLEEILQSNQCTFEREILDEIIKECTELNPWLPIDENTPKDRRLNLYWPNYGWFTGSWRMNQYFCDVGLMVPVNINPTHWQELPEDPE